MTNFSYNKTVISKNFDDFLFPVGKHNIYFDKEKFDDTAKSQPLAPFFPQFAKKFKAVVDEERCNMLECVSNSYTLITNDWAYQQGMRVAQRMFHCQDEEISFFNGTLTEDRGACTMNFLIHKEIEISGVKNRWHAYLHIVNSYNRTSPLCYEAGFFLEKMEDKKIPIGMLIPSLSLEYSANHGWHLETIKKKLFVAVNKKYGGLDVFAEFRIMVEELTEIEVIEDEILPLFCKLANIKKLDPENPKHLYLARVLMNIDKVAKEWIETCDYNAYAALCSYADFASKYTDDMMILFKEPTEYESLLGKLMDDLIIKKHKHGKDFSLDKYIGEEGRSASKQIKLMSRK